MPRRARATLIVHLTAAELGSLFLRRLVVNDDFNVTLSLLDSNSTAIPVN